MQQSGPNAVMPWLNYAQLFGCEPFSPTSARSFTA